MAACIRSLASPWPAAVLLLLLTAASVRSLALSWSAAVLLSTRTPSATLTESEALRLFRDSAYHSELRSRVALARADSLRHRAYPNPSVSAISEGAGRTDFLLLEQPLSINGRRNLLLRASESAVLAIEKGVEHAQRELDARLRAAFFRLVHAQERKSVISEGVSELEALARTIRQREAAGDASRFDRLRAEREIVELELEGALADASIATARGAVHRLLGDELVAGQVVAQGSLEAAYGAPTLEEALASGLDSRSDYRVEVARLEQARLQGAAAERLRIPNPVLVGGLKRAEAQDRFSSGPVLGISIDVPVFQKGKADRERAAAEAQRTRARARILDLQIRAEIRQAHDTLRIRRQLVRDHRLQARARASELLAIAEVAYTEGELSIAELLEAYRHAHSTRLRQLDLQAEAKLAEVEFDRSIAKGPVP